MSHLYLKTEYNTEGAYGSIDKHTLYAHINNSCDIVTFYEENGTILFSVEDTLENNLLDAINRLYSNKKDSSVESMTKEDRERVFKR